MFERLSFKVLHAMTFENVIIYIFVYFGFCIGLGATNKYDIEHKDLKLELVQTFFRHGARTPQPHEFEFLNYSGLDAYEPYGLGQLTNFGKEQMYKVGQMLRQRYYDFLPKDFNSSDVYAYSSDDDRTKMSLQLVLAGLYPPSHKLCWNQNLKWIPLPARYTPKELDILLKAHHSSRLLSLHDEVKSSTEYKHKMSEYSNLFDRLRENIAFDQSVTPMNIVELTLNTLYANKHMKISLPEWYTNEVKQDLFNLTNYFHQSMSATTEMKRINGGPLIRTFLENMNVNDNFINPRKIYLYSGHDQNLIAVTSALGISKTFEYPHYGSGLIVEKWRDSKSNQLYVKWLVWTVPGEKPKTLELNSCRELCPAQDYIRIMNKHDVIPSNGEMNLLYDEFISGKKAIQDLFFSDSAVKAIQI